MGLVGTPLELFEAILDVQSQIDENTIGVRFDLVGAEEDIGLEIGQRFINNVGLSAVLGKTGRGTSDGALNGQDGHIADPADPGNGNGGMIGLINSQN